MKVADIAHAASELCMWAERQGYSTADLMPILAMAMAGLIMGNHPDEETQTQRCEVALRMINGATRDILLAMQARHRKAAGEFDAAS
jgi:hypothetical protein